MGPTQVATPDEVADLTEAEARALFRKLRFVENGGEPFCPHCGSVAFNELRTRPLFKCKGCQRQYSLTSGTHFAYRKLSFKSILKIAAQINVAYQGRSAREIHRDLKKKIKNYRTVLIWCHKFRAALKKFQSTLTLSGEVEIDGAETGGYIRPKNTAKERSDHRKVPYRAADRKMFVTLARQRDGSSLAWVAKQEHYPIKPLMDCLEPGTVVFSDGGKWNAIREKFKLFQVPHKWTYYTPEACTNFAESGFNAFRTLARIHRRVTSTYLDLYAAQLAWRLDRNRMTDEEGLTSLLSPMMAKGRSPMAGYFLPKKKGGVKRRCEIINEEGEAGTWAPPTPEERKKAKAERARATGAVETCTQSSLRMARSKKRWKEGFEFITAKEFLTDTARIPIGPSVYAIFVRDGDRILTESGFEIAEGGEHWRLDQAVHLYTGETYSIRERIHAHLSGDGHGSNLRETLLALERAMGCLGLRDLSEGALNDWLIDQVVIGYKSCGYVKEVERLMLEHAPSPLNIRDRKPTAYSHMLTALRRSYRASVAA